VGGGGGCQTQSFVPKLSLTVALNAQKIHSLLEPIAMSVAEPQTPVCSPSPSPAPQAVFPAKAAVSRMPFFLFRRQSQSQKAVADEPKHEDLQLVNEDTVAAPKEDAQDAVIEDIVAAPAPPKEDSAHLLGMLVATIQDYDAKYAVTATVRDRASQLKEGHPETVEAMLNRAQGTYKTIKAVLPESLQEQVASIEDELLKMDAAKFDGHVQDLDRKIHDTYVHIEGAAKEYVNGAIDKASTRAESGLQYAEESLDYVLAPSGETDKDESVDDLDLNAAEKKEGESSLQTDKLRVIAHKATRLSKKAQKRLQKRVLRGFSDLKLRQGRLLDGTVDLIQYNRFLDVDAVRKKAGEATKAVGDAITTQLDVVDGMVVQPARELTEKAAKAVGDVITTQLDVVDGMVVQPARELTEKVQKQVVQPAKEFYTLVVVEFVNNPSQTTQEFLKTMQTKLGSEWSSQLEEPTERLRAGMAETWGHLKEVGLDYRESVEVTILDLVETLQKRWDELPVADRGSLSTSSYVSYFAAFAPALAAMGKTEDNADEEPALVEAPVVVEAPEDKAVVEEKPVEEKLPVEAPSVKELPPQRNSSFFRTMENSRKSLHIFFEADILIPVNVKNDKQTSHKPLI
jgi:hypothetical protein